jgi:protein-tyrosine phosphatase
MVDLHCHILPSVDDGARDLADSIELARKAVQQGIKTIVATPHHLNNQFENHKQIILAKTEELNEALRVEGIDLTVLPGQEVRIHGEMLEGYQLGEILPVNHTKHVLVEFPSSQVPTYTERLFYDLQVNGLIPIIVHPERNQQIIERPEMLYQLVKKGALTQVTAASITGDFGKKIKSFTLQLIEANLTHFIASDAHNTGSRTFKMSEAYHLIQQKYGQEMVYMLKENAEMVIAGQHVYKDIPERVRKKKFLGIF